MSRFRLVVTSVLLGFLALSCNAPQPQSQSGEAKEPGHGQVVAEVDGRVITLAELEDWIKDDLFKRETADKDASELYQFRAERLDQMIHDELLAAEAKRRNTTSEQLLEQESAPKSEVTEDAVRSFYEANKARMGNATLEQIGPRIRQYLEQEQRVGAQRAFLESLRKSASVDVKLDPPRIEVTAQGPARGPQDAPVTIVEFSDYQCPFCRRAEPVVKQVLERYPDKVRFVFRHFPLDQIHPRARPAAEAAACADEQGKFWEFHEKLFTGEGKLEDADFVKHAAEVGAEQAAFEQCVKERRFKDVVESDLQAGRQAGVSGTPAFFVNGILLSGARPLEAFVQVIDRELARHAEQGEAEPDAS